MRSPRLLPAISTLALCCLAMGATAKPAPLTPGYSHRPEPWRAPVGLHQAAAAGTTFFGGTFWAADSGRWEAIQDSAWTFDTGVGSHFDHSAPYVNPFKDPSLHALMEGWSGADRTFNDNSFFRRVSESDFGVEPPCVGDAAGLGGDWSLWCGVLPQEAVAMCFAGGVGYGTGWNICMGQTFGYPGGNATLAYDYVADSEPNFDFTYTIVDTGGVGNPDHDVTLFTYDGVESGSELLVLSPGNGLPYTTGGDIVIKFCFRSDGAYDDSDNLYDSDCGAFAVDDITLSGAISHAADFETSNDGWGLLPATPGVGEFTQLKALGDLPPLMAPCDCGLEDSVLTFFDPGTGLIEPDLDNMAISPWIDLLAAGVQGGGKVVEFDIYGDLPLANNAFLIVEAQWYPDVCPVTGKLTTSTFQNDGFLRHFDNDPECRVGDGAFRNDLSGVIPPGAEQVRISLRVFATCLGGWFCEEPDNGSPYVDRARLGVYGTPLAPTLTQRSSEGPRDSFPEDGSLQIDSPARIDATLRWDDYTLGDTLVVNSSAENIEVRVQFAVDPGPGVDPVAFQAWLTGHQFEETKYGLDWYSARMDTAQTFGFPRAGRWMTAYHEDDPNFTGTDTDPDPNDIPPVGVPNRLLNDIFPDDLFTPGTHMRYFYKVRYIGESIWGTLPDTSGTGTEGTLGSGIPGPAAPFLEWEALPSSMSSDSDWNCVLYVDHASGYGSQAWIEAGLSAVIPGGSDNFENTGWDRLDVDNPVSVIPVGRPIGAEYGFTLTQLSGYRAIVWDSGSLTRGVATEDADLLIPWLTGTSVTSNLYMTGDDLVEYAYSEGPSTFDLVENYLGAQLHCDTFRDADCPTGSVEDTSACIAIDPVVGAVASTRPLAAAHAGYGNGCPRLRSFEVFDVNPAPGSGGTAQAEEEYDDTVKGVTALASVSVTHADYRSLLDGLSLAHRRDAGDCIEHPAGEPSVDAIADRLTEFLAWAGYDGNNPSCFDLPTTDAPEPGPAPVHTALLAMAPNPLVPGARGVIGFNLATESRVQLDVFDVRGARVATLVDATLPVGEHEAVWRGTDDRGRPVASGVYFYRLSVGGESFNRKLVVVLQ